MELIIFKSSRKILKSFRASLKCSDRVQNNLLSYRRNNLSQHLVKIKDVFQKSKIVNMMAPVVQAAKHVLQVPSSSGSAGRVW